MLNACDRHGIKNFVFSSTASVYGTPQYIPMDEDHTTNPINYYGETKLQIERNLKWFSELRGIRFAALRYFNAAGYDVKGRIKGKEKNPQNLIPIVMEVASGVRSKMAIFGQSPMRKPRNYLKFFSRHTGLQAKFASTRASFAEPQRCY